MISGLQWGHDKIVMEVPFDSYCSFNPYKLQWGHDKIVMEVSLNGILPRNISSLQWGHDKIVMEVSFIIPIYCRRPTASMGP